MVTPAGPEPGRPIGWRRLVESGAPEHSVPLRLWTLAAVIVSVFAVTAHDDFLQYRLTIPVLAAVGFAFSYWRRGRRNWWVKLALSVLCLWVGYLFLLDVVRDPYHTSVPLTVLLLWLQTLHSFDVPARRDLLFSLLTSAILMTVAAAFALDIAFLVYLGLYALVSVQALAHNAWQASADAAPGRAWGPALSGAAIPGRAAVVGRGMRGMAWAASHLLVVVMLGAAVVFVLTPRLEGMRITALPFSAHRMLVGLFSGGVFNPAYPDAGDGGGVEGGGAQVWNPRGYFGFSPTVDLRMRGRLDDAIVMRVRATHALNWRALVFDTYTGIGWRISDRDVEQVRGTYPPISLVHKSDEPLIYGARQLRVVQTFYVEREQPNVIFAAPMAERLYVTAGAVFLDRYGSIRLPGTLQPGMVYSVVSRAFVPDPARLRVASGLVPEAMLARYRALPTIPDRVRDLGIRLTAGQPTLYDRVMAVNRHLWSEYRYDLSIPHQRKRGDAVDYFLFEERRGYCEQFASAMVVLLRSAGIPSRLVTGYGPGTPNPVTGLLEVRNSDAHAWVEVFFPGIGWVEFEPTPGFPDTADLGRRMSGRLVIQDLAALAAARLQAWASRSPAITRLLEQASGAGTLALRVGLWGLAIAAGALAGATAWRAAAAASHPARPRDALGDAYLLMCRILARRGLRRDPTETVGEFSRRVRAHTGGLPEVEALSAMVEEAAYGGAQPGPHSAASAKALLEALRGRLRRGRL